MEEYITIALPKGKLFKRSLDLLGKVGYSAEGVSENSRKLVIANEETKVRFIITKTVEMPKPQEPVRLQPYNDSRDVSWIGKQYHVNINRQPSDSLPMVKDETGQQFVDNYITMEVSRQDGSKFYSHKFTKKDFDKYLDDDYRETGILEGLVFDKADGDWLEFAASVCHPQTDEYIPLIVRLSRMGQLTIQRDSQMDTSPDESQKQEEKEQDDEI